MLGGSLSVLAWRLQVFQIKKLFFGFAQLITGLGVLLFVPTWMLDFGQGGGPLLRLRLDITF
jgi:hypothetical protein